MRIKVVQQGMIVLNKRELKHILQFYLRRHKIAGRVRKLDVDKTVDGKDIYVTMDTVTSTFITGEWV